VHVLFEGGLGRPPGWARVCHLPWPAAKGWKTSVSFHGRYRKGVYYLNCSGILKKMGEKKKEGVCDAVRVEGGGKKEGEIRGQEGGWRGFPFRFGRDERAPFCGRKSPPSFEIGGPTKRVGD